MLCMECGAETKKEYTTTAVDLENSRLEVKNVPCYKCTKCNEIIYTGDVIEGLEKIAEYANILCKSSSFNDYDKSVHNAEYLTMIDCAMKQPEEGKGQIHELISAEDY